MISSLEGRGGRGELGLMPPAQDTLPATEQTFWAGRRELGGVLLTMTRCPDPPVCGGHGQGQTQLQGQAYGYSDAQELLVGPSSTPHIFHLCPLEGPVSIPAFHLHRLLISPELVREWVREQATPHALPFHPLPSAGMTFL